MSTKNEEIDTGSRASEIELMQFNSPDPQPTTQSGFELKTFFPYLVRVYYRAVSQSVQRVYTKALSLTVSEWRTMAVLGPNRALAASDIVEKSSMDKVNVSRAVAGLRRKGLITQSIDENDRRRALLRLTDKGSQGYEMLIPQIKALEQNLLAGLSDSEKSTLLHLMEKVRANVENLDT